MSQQVRFGLTARRWIRPQPLGDDVVRPLPVDSNGFLDLSAADAAGLVSPREATKHRGCVFLGQPGSGKTTSVNALLDSFGPGTGLPAKPDVITVSGSELTAKPFS